MRRRGGGGMLEEGGHPKSPEGSGSSSRGSESNTCVGPGRVPVLDDEVHLNDGGLRRAAEQRRGDGGEQARG